MPTKERTVEPVGEKGLLLPELINRGLAANDRLRYYMTLLQAAAAHAQAPNLPAANLRDEREASGVEDPFFDEVVRGSRSLTPDLYLIPGASRLFERMVVDLREMLEALPVAATSNSELGARLQAYIHRVDVRVAQTPRCEDDHVPARTVDALTRRADNGHDTMQRLVTDLRWELNRLQAGHAIEIIDGARVHGLAEADRRLVRAFMKGVHQTAALRFDHRGPATTATRAAGRLTIENDLGTSDSQRVAVHVSDLNATVLYTDSRRSRAGFLQHLLESYPVQWEIKPAVGEAGREVRVGSFTGQQPQDVEQYLTALGSRLAFLIDWKRTRKRLARLVKSADADLVLKWAAENNIGHRAFLQAGDIHLIHAALERAIPAQMRVGVRLDELLGRDAARDFLKTVLAIVSAGMMSHRSMRLINDEIEAELLTYLETTDQTALAAAADHAVLLSALSDRLRGALLRLKTEGTSDDAVAAAEAAQTLKVRAEETVGRLDRLLEPSADGHSLRRLMPEAGSVADVLEQAAFTLTLVPERSDPKGIAFVDELADLVSQGTRAYARCIEDARDIRRASTRRDLERLLVTVDHLTDLEHQSHAIERLLESTLMCGAADFRQLHVLSGLAAAFQRAIQSLARSGLIVRDYVLATRSGVK
jgi:hypothetical protein